MESKNWIGTCFLETFPIVDGVEYLVYQREKCPKTEKLHWQFFVVLKSKKRLPRVSKMFGNAHVEIARDLIKSRDYCMKLETRVSGPVEQGVFKKNSMLSVVQLLKLKPVLEVIEERPTLWRNLRSLLELKEAFTSPRKSPTQGILLTGLTGSGKSKIAQTISDYLGEAFWAEPEMKWWDGYASHPLVVVDEFRGGVGPAPLLRLIDRYPLKVPVKGAMREFKSSMVILTSNLSLGELFPNVDRRTMQAINRRIKEYIVY